MCHIECWQLTARQTMRPKLKARCGAGAGAACGRRAAGPHPSAARESGWRGLRRWRQRLSASEVPSARLAVAPSAPQSCAGPAVHASCRCVRSASAPSALPLPSFFAATVRAAHPKQCPSWGWWRKRWRRRRRQRQRRASMSFPLIPCLRIDAAARTTKGAAGAADAPSRAAPLVVVAAASNGPGPAGSGAGAAGGDSAATDPVGSLLGRRLAPAAAAVRRSLGVCGGCRQAP